MIKLCTTTIRKYAVRLAEINGCLNDFPLHQANLAIPMDELLETLEFTIPVSWQHPLQQMIVQFVKFCEWLESKEQVFSGMIPKKVRNEKNDKI